MEKIRASLLFCLFALLALTACQDDEDFSQSASDLLTFSADTIRLDTVFSTVPSSTRSFWVYNRSGHSLRCTNVRLENGNQIGFRVNVDGTYLSPEAGYQASDIEVRKNDSIRVFVELTSSRNFGDAPTLIEDNLVFILESGVRQKVNLNAFSWDATIARGLTVTSDSTIDASERPLVVYGGIDVAENATLTIAPGSTLYFHDGAGLNVHGRLIAAGEQGREVTLRGDRLDNMFDYLPYNYVSGQWAGVRLYESSYDNRITYTDIHSSYDGLVVDSADVERLKLTLDHSTIHNCQGSALSVTNTYVTVSNCQLTNTLGHCLLLDGGRMTVNNCTLAQFYPYDSARGTALHVQSTKTPVWEFACLNTLITGYGSDEMTIERVEDRQEECNFAFDHCIIRTPRLETEDSLRFTHVVFEDATDTAQAARKHFLLIDEDNLRYDFHLTATSPAVGAADSLTALPTDRTGLRRDERPDIGAYEYVEPTGEE